MAKKLLAWAVSAAMTGQLMTGLTAFAEQEDVKGYAVTVNSVSVTDNEANGIDVSVSTSGEYTAYISVYNGDGTLSGIRLADASETGSVSFDGISFTEGQTLRCMVWDGTMSPVAEVFTLENGTSTQTETPSGTEAPENGYIVTFDTDEHASVTVYDTQDTSAGGTENAATAYARNSSTGEIDVSGDGQVNFTVVLDDGYEIDTITAEGGYKNLKSVSGTTYRVTKVTGAVTVTVTTKESSPAGEQEGDGVIHLNNTSIDATGISGATVSGKTVTLTDNAAAYDSAEAAYIYNIEGALDDGQIIVAASDKASEIVLKLDNVSVTSSTGNALDATTGEVTLANVSGSTSTFISTYTGTDATTGEADNGAGIYSKNDLTIKGADSSTKIVAKSTYGNGIRCKADLEIGAGDIEVEAGNNGIKGDESIKLTKKAGNITVTAAGDGIKTDAIDSETLELDTDSSYQPKGNITINGGTISIVSGGDGIQADYGFIAAGAPSITIASGADGIKANTSADEAWYYTDETRTATAAIAGYVDISGGTFDITANGGAGSRNTTDESCKGIKAADKLNITGGTFDIDSYDDAIHSNYTVSITGGTFELASADDGVHADYRLTMGTEDGADDDYTMNISTSYEALEGSVIEYLSGTTTLYSTDDGVNAAGDYEENGTYHGTTTSSTNELQIAAGPGGGGGWNPGGGPDHGMDDSSDYGMLYIKGGRLYVRADGDGLDSNGSALMSGGTVVVAGTTKGGNGVFDKGDKSGDSFKVTGGTLVGFGTTAMQDNPTVTGQGYLNTTTSLTKGTLKNIKLNSSEYIGIIPEITLSNALMFVTTPEMTSGSGSVYSGSVSYSDSDKLLGRTVSNTWYGIYKK